MSEAGLLTCDIALEQETSKPVSVTKSLSRSGRVLRNILTSLLRIGVNALVAVLLPAFLIHRLPVATYSAWVLILQMAALVSYLDVGAQAAIAKFIAEYHAKGDLAGCSRAATAGFRVLLATGSLGFVLSPAVAWLMPSAFQQIPAALRGQAQIAVMLVGASLSFNLVCSAFGALFLGLQRYQLPNTIGIVNKLVYAVVVSVAVYLSSSMVTMGCAVAAVNLATGLFQIYAWRRWAGWVSVAASLAGGRMLREVLEYCGILGIWSAAMLCVSGLDLALVAHFDFAQTAYYATASAPTNLMILLLSAGLGPLMPATSALSVEASAARIGDLLVRVTRYAVILLLLAAAPLIIFAHPLLKLWVGAVYAEHAAGLMIILVLANLVRSTLAPYATFVIATGRQRVATISAVSEGIANLVASVALAGRYGACGVAYGTLIGAFIGLLVHFLVSMHFTYKQIAVRRLTLLRDGIGRPFILALPTLFLLIAGWRSMGAHSVVLDLFWAFTTLAAVWFVGLKPGERDGLRLSVSARLPLLQRESLG